LAGRRTGGTLGLFIEVSRNLGQVRGPELVGDRGDSTALAEVRANFKAWQPVCHARHRGKVAAGGLTPLRNATTPAAAACPAPRET
jgi:hypothetical protein